MPRYRFNASPNSILALGGEEHLAGEVFEADLTPDQVAAISGLELVEDEPQVEPSEAPSQPPSEVPQGDEKATDLEKAEKAESGS